MTYQDYEVKVTFLKDETGAVEYDLPHVFHISDPKEGMKATIIKGTRGDGAIVIPGGKESQELRVRGKLVDNRGYKYLTELMNTMRTNLTTDIATLTLKHKEGVSWVVDWAYTVRRVTGIEFPESLRTGIQEYEVRFLIIAF